MNGLKIFIFNIFISIPCLAGNNTDLSHCNNIYHPEATTTHEPFPFVELLNKKILLIKFKDFENPLKSILQIAYRSRKDSGVLAEILISRNGFRFQYFIKTLNSEGNELESTFKPITEALGPNDTWLPEPELGGGTLNLVRDENQHTILIPALKTQIQNWKTKEGSIDYLTSIHPKFERPEAEQTEFFEIKANDDFKTKAYFRRSLIDHVWINELSLEHRLDHFESMQESLQPFDYGQPNSEGGFQLKLAYSNHLQDQSHTGILYLFQIPPPLATNEYQVSGKIKDDEIKTILKQFYQFEKRRKYLQLTPEIDEGFRQITFFANQFKPKNLNQYQDLIHLALGAGSTKLTLAAKVILMRDANINAKLDSTTETIEISHYQSNQQQTPASNPEIVSYFKELTQTQFRNTEVKMIIEAQAKIRNIYIPDTALAGPGFVLAELEEAAQNGSLDFSSQDKYFEWIRKLDVTEFQKRMRKILLFKNLTPLTIKTAAISMLDYQPNKAYYFIHEAALLSEEFSLDPSIIQLIITLSESSDRFAKEAFLNFGAKIGNHSDINSQTKINAALQKLSIKKK